MTLTARLERAIAGSTAPQPRFKLTRVPLLRRASRRSRVPSGAGTPPLPQPGDTGAAMSRANVELVRSWFDRWNAGDRETREEEIHPNAEIVTRLLGRTERGPEGLRRWFREIEEQFDEWFVTVEEWRDAGDRVGALGSVRLRGRGSGVAFDAPVGLLFENQGGRLSRLETFVYSPRSALEVVGLRESAMSQNVAVVLDQYAATNERDFRRAMSYYDDDVELVAREPWLR